jgi:hypothetical protein
MESTTNIGNDRIQSDPNQSRALGWRRDSGEPRAKLAVGDRARDSLRTDFPQDAFMQRRPAKPIMKPAFSTLQNGSWRRRRAVSNDQWTAHCHPGGTTPSGLARDAAPGSSEIFLFFGRLIETVRCAGVGPSRRSGSAVPRGGRALPRFCRITALRFAAKQTDGGAVRIWSELRFPAQPARQSFGGRSRGRQAGAGTSGVRNDGQQVEAIGNAEYRCPTDLAAQRDAA